MDLRDDADGDPGDLPEVRQFGVPGVVVISGADVGPELRREKRALNGKEGYVVWLDPEDVDGE